MQQPDLIAGLVLGSNSFHLLTVRRQGGTLTRETHLQEAVQLAAGVDADGDIAPEYLEKARACLARFAAALSEAGPVSKAAAVATGVLRSAANAGELLELAAATLDMPVHVLSGRDEAFLTYVGVVLTLERVEDSRLVIDIGGGSTELVIGRGYTVMRRESVDMGCIPATRRYFAAGFSEAAFDAAESELRSTFEPLTESLGPTGWGEAVGTGGTINTAGAIMQLRRLCGSAVSRKGLDRFKAAMIGQRLDELGRDITTAERLAVLPGGVALMSALLDTLGIERMRVSRGALREGVLIMLARGGLPGTRVVRPGS